MKESRRIMLLLLAIILAVSISACSSKETEDTTEKPVTTPSEEHPINSVMQSLLDGENMLKPYDKESVTKKIDVSEYGVKADDPTAADANSEAINLAVADAEENTEIYFPTGTYYIASTNERFGISVNEKKNLLINGNGSTLINVSYTSRVGKTSEYYNHGSIVFFNNCKDVTFDNFALDYFGRTSMFGTVEKISEGKTYIRISDEYLTDGKEPLDGGELAACIHIIKDGVPEKEWYLLDGEAAILAEKIEPTLIAFSGEYGVEGDAIAVRFGSGNYSRPPVYFQRSSGITLRDTTVYSSPCATCYVLPDNENIRFERLNIVPKDGTPIYFSSSADGVHTIGVRGRLEFIDCKFIGLGDDAINIHSKTADVARVKENRITITDPQTGISSPRSRLVPCGRYGRIF